MTGKTDIIITGGGMVGMSAGIALARLGLRVIVLERMAMPAQLAPAFDGRVSAIALGSMRLLQRIGAWDFMAPHAEPIRDIHVSDGDSPFFVHYDHRDIGDEPFGTILENRHIRHGLQQAAALWPELTIIDNARVAAFENSGGQAHVTLEDGRTFSAPLALAADGRQSMLRELAGIEATLRDYRQVAIVATIAHTRPHHGLAQERFLPAGPFAVLPMQGNRSSLVWVEPQDRARLYIDLPKEECEQEIAERVGGYLGTVTLAGERFAYPLAAVHTKTYIASRLALVGDAAHGIHPIAGQGVNLGFRDVAVLEELIRKQHALGLDIGADSLLAHYQRWRRFDNVSMLGVTDGLNQLFCNTLLPVKTARGLGLWTVNKLPPLKRFFMKHAMGLAGDVPEAMQKAG
jgi:2-octaprenyl-6-methoxyphenol hydroxylase